MTYSHGRVLVTGGSGFGGSHLVRRLTRNGNRVWNVDIRAPKDHDATYVAGDVRDIELLRAVLSSNAIDTVFHLAAQPLIPLSIKAPFETLDVNSRGTYAVLEACRTVGVAALVVASSGAYYGATTIDEPIPESAAPLPASNLYAAGKAAADLAAQGYAHTFDMPVGVCRFMNTYGPDDANTSRLIPHAISLLENNRPYTFGTRDDGTARLDFVHIDDMTSAYLAVATFVAEHGGRDAVFNIGTGVATPIADVARLVSQAYDGVLREPIFSGPRQELAVVKYLDPTKARVLLGWQSSITIADGIASVIDAKRRGA